MQKSNFQKWVLRCEAWYAAGSNFPWRVTLQTLKDRFREDRLGLTAGSLTFTTTLALVPFVTLILAIFTVFPVFERAQDIFKRWLVQSLVPEAIARQLETYLIQFASQAGQLGALGLVGLVVTALALILTIDRTLNTIWRVPKIRPLGQRVLIYWSILTLGPLLLGGSLVLTSLAISASHGVAHALPGGAQLLLNALQFFILAAGMAGFYRYVPNTHVKWKHAWVGGVFVSVGMVVARKLLGFYLTSVPTYSLIYGTFALLPILLIWIYLVWVIVLLGAVVAAYLPSLIAGVARRAGGNGWQFQLAIEILQHLQHAQKLPSKGWSAADLAEKMRVDVLQCIPVLEALRELDWVGLLEESDANQQDVSRYILLASPATTALQPLLETLLLEQTAALAGFWQAGKLDQLRLSDIMHPTAT